MSNGHCFISYSHADGLAFVIKLVTELEGGYPSIPAWFEKRDIHSDRDDWDDQLAKAIQQCKCLVYVMSQDSTAEHSNCKDEWAWALKYKKPVICLWISSKAEDQFRLNSRQKIDFTADFGAGLGKLRKAIAHLDSPEGQLEELKHRLADANRDLRRANDEKKSLIEADIEELKKQIEAQEKVAENPEAAKKQTEQNIQNGLERERKPEKPVISNQLSKFINQPPGVAQDYFQDRTMETEQAILFLKNEAQRVLTVAGRGGAGKTAMTCRLLKHIENGTLPDDFVKKHGKIEVDGIVYLSEAGSRKINFANLFADLCQLLPKDVSAQLDALYKTPQASTDTKTHQLLESFHGFKRVIVLLDNFENVVRADAQEIADAELDEALKALLHAPHHPIKIIITTRVAPYQFGLYEPACQRPLPLDSGLAPQYAREAFILMDEGELVGIKHADGNLLDLAVTRTLGLPRALEALYAALRSDRYTTLEELLALPVLPENVVSAYVGEAFNRLDTNAQKVMQALAVYNRPVTPAAVDYLLAPHIPAIDSAPILQRLANMHFARKESGRFYLHPVDREFAFGLVPEKLTAESAGNAENQLKTPRSLRAPRLNAFTQHDLTSRAADYFKQARKPRAEWKKLDDLQAQRDEFDLRCAAEDYDTAVSVLRDFDFDYLLLWGHYRLMIQMHEKVTGKINDPTLKLGNLNGLGLAYQYLGDARKSILYFEQGIPAAQGVKNRGWEGAFLGNLGLAYADLGDARKAIEFYEKALVIAREIGDRRGEGADLGNLGLAYADLGDARKAIEFYEKQLVIVREIGDRRGEGADLGNLGNAYAALGDARKAIEFYEKGMEIAREIGDRRGESIGLENIGHAYLSIEESPKATENYQQAIQIADDILFPQTQNYARWGLAQAHLFQNDLVNARAAIEAALGYDVPKNNHNASALHGIIALRQGEEVAARGAFVRAIGQADEILSKTAEYYEALDAKGLAICGLILCWGAVPAPVSAPNAPAPNHTIHPTPDNAPANLGRGDPAPTVEGAIETFRKARKIASHAGVVKSTLRLFDELAKCDTTGLLAPIRAAAAGEQPPQ